MADLRQRLIDIDIARPFEYLATCPQCGMQRSLPESWQTLLRASTPGVEAHTWDGVLRCRRNGHDPQPMIVVPVINPALPEPDGTYLSHLVMDSDHRRALCTGSQWGGLPPEATTVRFCQACYRAACGEYR